MPLMFYRTDTPHFRTGPINLDIEPCPTIMAGGIAGGNTSQYYLRNERNAMPEYKHNSDKPLYQVPCMQSIRDIPHNFFNVASTFAGCGGSSLGWRMAGFRVVYALDSDQDACMSYRPNMSESTFLDNRDIRKVRGSDILSKTPNDSLDVLDGSPPCVSFSTAGKREKKWGKLRTHAGLVQTQDDLFGEYLRLVDETRPKVFVAENVSGMVKGVSKGYFIEVLRKAKSLGYNTRCRLLDAQWLGVPQARQRVIFIGVRNDLYIDPSFPEPLPYRYSLRDACPWIAREITSHGTRPAEDAPAATITSGGHTVSPTAKFGGLGMIEAETDISRYAIGEEAGKLAIGEQSSKYFSLIRARQDRPSPTITASGGSSSLASVIHPYEKRKFSIAELKRICSFPNDFILVGSYAQQWARLGNSVPPLMMKAIADVVRDNILSTY